MVTFRIFIWFQKAIWCSIFGNSASSLTIAGKELISKPTFRQPDKAFSDIFIGFKIFKRSFYSLSIKEELPNLKVKILVYDGLYKSFDKRKSYLIWVKGYKEEEIFGLGRDTAYKFANKILCRLFLILLSIIVLPFTIISKRRVQWALIFSEYIETCGLITFAVAKKCSTLHFFSPAEKDSNLAYLIAKDFGISVTKHPSPGALVAHNRFLIADTLAFSSLYQQEEYMAMLNKTIKVRTTEIWPAENAEDYDYLYSNKAKTDQYDYLYGYYSHGGWLRKEKGRTEGLFARPEEEERCLLVVAEMLKQQKTKTILIYLHPKEKKDLVKTKEYYLKIFNSIGFDLYTEDLSSAYTFNKVKYGIGAYSTILFERLNYGFSTFVWREEKKDFPLKGTMLFENSFCNTEDLKHLLVARNV